jgi:hypothetical protein
VNPEPAIVTLVPAGPLAGPNDVSFGTTLNVPTLWPDPDPVTTVSFPVDASAGTTTFRLPAVTLVGTAITPLKSTLVAPPNAFPYTVIVAPTGALPGEKLVTRGSTNNASLAAVPPEVVTVIGPVAALLGTVSLNCVRDGTENPAQTPFTFTELTPPKPVPSTVTTEPAAALPGEKPVIVGGTFKLAALVAVPPAVVTETCPLAAAAGTSAAI